MASKKLFITGGAGFIGSAVIRHIINNTSHSVVNVDKLTYAGNLESLTSIENNARYTFEQVDICDANEIKRVFNDHQPDKAYGGGASEIETEMLVWKTKPLGRANFSQSLAIYHAEWKGNNIPYHQTKKDGGSRPNPLTIPPNQQSNDDN